MTETEIKNVAKEAVREFLLVIGVDISTNAAAIELQKDFHHVRQTRLTVGAVRDKILMALTGSAVTGVGAAVVFYLTKH